MERQYSNEIHKIQQDPHVNVVLTSYLCRCDVITSHRHQYGVISTACAPWVAAVDHIQLVSLILVIYPYLRKAAGLTVTKDTMSQVEMDPLCYFVKAANG